MREDTICAISTAPGMGAIAVIRISGEESFEITDKIFKAANHEASALKAISHTMIFGSIKDGDEFIDEVVVAIFKNPKSFTGEDIVEISCHGSVYIQQRIIQLLIKNGCRMAQPGEFSRRAFKNGKMDLSQAEAIADLIASTSAANHKLALNQMKGGISKEIEILREKMLKFLSLMELELDFSEEDVEFANREQLMELCTTIENKLIKLTSSFKLGNAIKNGIPVAIVGETNAGKSTLLNKLLNEEKAIVSDIHGTTRDVIEDTAVIKGVEFRFIDTAGLRETNDEIELMGIERSYKQIEKANIVIWVVDSTEDFRFTKKVSGDLKKKVNNKDLIILFNKSDKVLSDVKENLDNIFSSFDVPKMHISAKNEDDVMSLKTKILELSGTSNLKNQDVVITNLRHYEALSSALASMKRAEEGLKNNISGDFISQDLRECNLYLSQITGLITTDEVLGSIFSHFCIGK